MRPLDSQQSLVVVRGGGELASGAIRRLFLAGFPVIVLEIEKPMCVRRTVSFANAVYEFSWEVEGVTAALSPNVEGCREFLKKGIVPMLVDEMGSSVSQSKPAILVDARMAKRNPGTKASDAPVVVALGPGFSAPNDAHFVIETCRGHDLGRVITSGAALPDSGEAGEIGGQTANRVLRAPAAGVFKELKEIGARVQAGEAVAEVAGKPVTAKIAGVLRGLLHDGVIVREGQKAGDVDPRGDPAFVQRISDKANAVAGGVLEAALRGLQMLD